MAEAVGMLEVFGLATALRQRMLAARLETSGWRILIKTNRAMQMSYRYL